MARFRAASAMAPIPFDKHGVPGTIEIVDDFVGAPLLADFVDTTGVQYDSGVALYHATEDAGAAVGNLTVPVSVADHQGIIRLETGATIPAAGDRVSLQFGGSAVGVQDSFLLDTNGLYIATVLRVADLDAQKVEFGLIGQTPAQPNSSAADVISFVWDPDDAANVNDELWLCQVNGGGSDTEQAVGFAYVESDWVLLEIAADSTSATFRITTEDNTETIVLDGADSVTMPTVGLRPVFSVETEGAAEEVLDIDLFVIRYLRRDALVADWLGQ